jgi:hypothetical protein
MMLPVQASVYRGAPNLVWGGWCGPVDGTDLRLVRWRLHVREGEIDCYFW